ncbi:MAG: fibronectin type III domain-containing protein [Nitrospirota bacterium]
MVTLGCGGGIGTGGDTNSGINNHNPVPTASITLSWDESDSNTDGSLSSDLAGYIVYYGTSSNNYTESINVGNNTSVVISSFRIGETYYIAVTAYNRSGNQSDYSDEIDITL